ncbi:MAG: hypothetical protein IPM66_12020 [Acidobacteriota bacterium]|nr:MAG: hypothetical protein IPM66_12020 [Acidobacteriota bacterium]
MARGWESKAVEQQMEEAAKKAPVRAAAGAAQATQESIEQRIRRENLKLTRSQLTTQLENSRSVSHRQMIHQSLRAIEDELNSLN